MKKEKKVVIDNKLKTLQKPSLFKSFKKRFKKKFLVLETIKESDFELVCCSRAVSLSLLIYLVDLISFSLSLFFSS